MKKTRLLEIIREEIDTAINEIPDFGGNSLILRIPDKNQVFLINSGFYTSSALSKRISHLCCPAGVRINAELFII